MEWIRRIRRRRLLARPFPDDWQAIIDRNVSHFAVLSSDERETLRRFVRVFVAEKSFEGCGGLEMTDEIRVTIAAQAGLLVLAHPHQYYRNVRSVLVYPSTIVTPERPLGVFEQPTVRPASGVPILGEAQLRGPVLLVWDAALRDARHPEHGHNVVYHEFAHKLDMLDGAADGTPPLGSHDALTRWAETCTASFLELRARVEAGRRTFLDAYGATSEAEFFAVATEFFFDRPREMVEQEPDLYGLLRDYYGQDPAARSAS